MWFRHQESELLDNLVVGSVTNTDLLKASNQAAFWNELLARIILQEINANQMPEYQFALKGEVDCCYLQFQQRNAWTRLTLTVKDANTVC